MRYAQIGDAITLAIGVAATLLTVFFIATTINTAQAVDHDTLPPLPYGYEIDCDLRGCQQTINLEN